MDYDKRVYSWKHLWNQRIRQDPHSRHSEDYRPYDGELEARGVGPLYEIRGLIVAQAAQIEDLLGHIVVERQSRARVCEHSPDPREARSIDDVLEQASATFCELGLCARLSHELAMVTWALEVRNALLSTVISFGFSDSGPAGAEHVINMDMTIQGRTPLKYSLPPGSEEDDWSQPNLDQPNQVEYARTLQSMRDALEAAVDLWVAFDEALPETPVRRLL
ncbi:hypothetical protein [Nocardiopsis sp. SBT366]|uniref:hypothetical protein n=1 Tax=Nocardiopsis sp. SBT366 TaxID=1580529 RepID=UPI00066B0BC5|nr:hypothetical protein [Nocardiopsis sp. SBT366]